MTGTRIAGPDDPRNTDPFRRRPGRRVRAAGTSIAPPGSRPERGLRRPVEVRS